MRMQGALTGLSESMCIAQLHVNRQQGVLVTMLLVTFGRLFGEVRLRIVTCTGMRQA
jgi:hypothetical protein